MISKNSQFFSLLVLMVSFDSICYADSNDQAPAVDNSLQYQVQQLQTDLSQTIARVSVLEKDSNSNLQFSKSPESLENTKLKGRVISHPHGR